jgi:hypothetical protein
MEAAGSERGYVEAGKNLNRNLRGGNVRRQKYMAVTGYDDPHKTTSTEEKGEPVCVCVCAYIYCGFAGYNTML